MIALFSSWRIAFFVAGAVAIASAVLAAPIPIGFRERRPLP